MDSMNVENYCSARAPEIAGDQRDIHRIDHDLDWIEVSVDSSEVQ